MINLPASWFFWRARSSAPVTTDSLDAFRPERGPDNSARFRDLPILSRRSVPRLGVVLALLLAGAAGATGYLWQKWPFRVQAAAASLTIESYPAGAEVFADGVRRGTTPLTLSVNPGEHAFEFVHEGRRKALRTVARAGAAVVHHVELEAPPPPPATTAALRIMTSPGNLRVSVNGKALGRSPLTASDLQPGAHKVQVTGTTGTIEREVEVKAGETASVIIAAGSAPSAAGPSAGWLAVTSPIALQILENREILGTSQSSKIMLPAGRHELQLTNEALGFSERRSVQVTSGDTAKVRVEVPNAPLSINALPWAEAWIDGSRIGETPIGNRLVSLGTHEILLRHPELGERRQTVTVTLKAPARVSVDMRKQ